MESWFLPTIIALPLIFAAVVPFIKPGRTGQPVHWFAMTASLLLLLFSLLAWSSFPVTGAEGAFVPASINLPWFPQLGISFALGMDGLSMTMVVLTTFLLFVSVIASKTNITKRHNLYYSMLFILAASLIGVFTARDGFLFFLFYELELIPMYFLIAIWGGPRREYASVKFVLYTLFGSVFLLVGLLGLYWFAQSQATAHPESAFLFSSIASALSTGTMALPTQLWLFALLFIAFSVKLPMVPFHTWLPDAHVEAPTPISMLLAGVLLKMGAYGLLRFCFTMMPDAAIVMAPYVALLAVISIVYAGIVALIQKDMKKVIAYSSVSHMGFVLLGLAALNAAGFNGAVFVMLSHGLVSAALFFCVGTLYIRTHTRMIAEYGGFAKVAPIIYGFFLLMGMASLGLPFLVSFPGETLVIYGAYLSRAFEIIPIGAGSVLPLSIQSLTFIGAVGVVIGAAYVLWLIQRVFTGPLSSKWHGFKDAIHSEVTVFMLLGVFVIGFGLCPHLLMKRFETEISQTTNVYGFRMTARSVGDTLAQQVADSQGWNQTVSLPAAPTSEWVR